MTTSRSVVIAEPVRTAIGTFGGTLKDMPAVTLGSAAIKAAVFLASDDASYISGIELFVDGGFAQV